jgi:hypothetical protein
MLNVDFLSTRRVTFMKESSVAYEKVNRLNTPVSGIYDLVSQYVIRALLPPSWMLRN